MACVYSIYINSTYHSYKNIFKYIQYIYPVYPGPGEWKTDGYLGISERNPRLPRDILPRRETNLQYI